MLINQITLLAAKLQSDRKGVTALEYGLIAALMGAAVVAGFVTLGPAVTQIFLDIAARLRLTPA